MRLGVLPLASLQRPDSLFRQARPLGQVSL
jgi:hypothetical protein